RNARNETNGEWKHLVALAKQAGEPRNAAGEASTAPFASLLLAAAEAEQAVRGQEGDEPTIAAKRTEATAAAAEKHGIPVQQLAAVQRELAAARGNAGHPLYL